MKATTAESGMLGAIAALALITGFFVLLMLKVWNAPHDSAMQTLSGDHMVGRLEGITETTASGMIPTFWARTVVASTDCPVSFLSPAGIDQALKAQRTLSDVERLASLNARIDMAAGERRILLPAAGSGEVVCRLARRGRTTGVAVQLLTSMPEDVYGLQYLDAYNQWVE